MKILLTGGRGFIGTHWLKMNDGEHDIYIYDLVDGNDVRDAYNLENLFNKERFDMVVNMAARAGVPMGQEYPGEFFSTNCLGLLNIIDVCKKYNAKLVHFSSSSAVEAKSIYGITKLAGEKMIEASGIDYIIIRPFTVIGENGRKEMVIFKWLGQYKRGEKISFYGDGSTFRGYTYVEDLLIGMKFAISSNVSREVLNIGGNQKVTLNELWDIFQSVFPDARRELIDLPDYDIQGEMADTSKITELTGWKHYTDVKKFIKQLLINEYAK